MLVLDWKELAQDRDRRRNIANSVMNFLVRQSSGNFLTSWETVGCSERSVLQEVTHVKGKNLTPWHANVGTERRRRYTTNSLATLVLDGVIFQHNVPADLPPRKTQYPFFRRHDDLRGCSGQARKVTSQPGFDSLSVYSVTNLYTDCTILTPI